MNIYNAEWHCRRGGGSRRLCRSRGHPGHRAVQPPASHSDLRHAGGGFRDLAEPVRPRRGEPGTLGPGGILTIQVTGQGGVPASGVSAVVMNVTVAGPTATSHLDRVADGGLSADCVEPQLEARHQHRQPGHRAGGQRRPGQLLHRERQCGRHRGRGWVVHRRSRTRRHGRRLRQRCHRPGSAIRVAAGPGVDPNECNNQGGAPGTLGPGGSLTAQVTGLAGVPSGANALVATSRWPIRQRAAICRHGLISSPGPPLRISTGHRTRTCPTWSSWSSEPMEPSILFNNAGSADVLVDVEGYYTAA